MYKFIIPGIPIPWKSHAGFGRRSFNPRFLEKKYVQAHLRQQFKDEMLAGPVCVRYEFRFPIPTSASKIRKKQMAENVMKHMKRPDITNCIKFYEDALKEIVIVDDARVVEMSAAKFYDAEPHTIIEVFRV